MKKNAVILASGILLLMNSCAFLVNAPHGRDSTIDTTGTTTKPPVTVPKISLSTRMYFPFEDNANWWRYTEASGNNVMIDVIDTISDNNTLYYKVSFKENRVDTTDDWFKRSSSGIMFGPSLVSIADMFLPATLDSVKGSFTSGASRVSYSVNDTMTVGGALFHKVLLLNYNSPVLHGFTEIAFADSVGIVQFKDSHERWPIVYAIDSCSVSGNVKVF
jgi:hypothetical protein